MLRRWSLLWLVAVLAAGRLSAASGSGSYSVNIDIFGPRAIAGTVSVDWDVAAKRYDLSLNYASDDGAAGFGAVLLFVEISMDDGDTWSLVRNHSKTGPAPTALAVTNQDYGSHTASSPTNLRVRVQAYVASSGLGHTPTPPALVLTLGAVVPPGTFGITVKLPANTTEHRKLYFAMQNGAQVGWATQDAGAAARDWYIGNLETDDVVSVVEVTGGTLDSYLDEDGDLQWVKSSGTETTPVSTGQPASAEPTAGSGATAETDVTGGGTQPAPSNPKTDAPEAPTPTSNPTAPTSTSTPSAPTAVTPFSPSGGDAVTKADAEAIANKQLEASDKIAQAVHQGAAANVTATDKVATAVWEAGKKTTESADKVSTSVWEAGKKQIEATDKVSAAVDKSRGELSGKMSQMIEKQNAMLGAQNTTNSKLDEIKEALEATDAKEAAETAADAAVASAATSSAAAVTGITSALPGSVNDLPYSPEVAGGSAAFLSIEMPSSFGGATVNFNPFANDAMAAIAAWFRSATAWLCYLLLGQFVFGQLRAALDTVATARQASGNPVFGGTGGQATAAVNAGLLTAAALVAVAALAAWAFEGINIAGLVSNLTASPLVGMSSNVFWFLDQFLPCATLITCAVARAAWHLYSGPVIATYITVCRWFIA